jgi:peptidyl-tRNA hydrolase, PTH1 family
LSLELIIGLANPGREYEDTRHNAGAWFIDQLARQLNTKLKLETKLNAQIGQANINGRMIRLAIPTTYMNESGISVGAISHFYKVPVENILIAHDEIDLLPGTTRLKFAGGEGGHNGLRSIVQHLGSKNFYRLRIGVGHPGNSNQVANYVLKAPKKDEQQLIDESIVDALDVMPSALDDEIERAMKTLHTNKN